MYQGSLREEERMDPVSWINQPIGHYRTCNVLQTVTIWKPSNVITGNVAMYVVIHACTITHLYFELKQLLNAQSEAGPLREGCEVILGPGQ